MSIARAFPHRCDDKHCTRCFAFIQGRYRRIVSAPGYLMEANEAGTLVPVHRFTAVSIERDEP